MDYKVLGGHEHCYLDAVTREKLWRLAEQREVSRNKIIAAAIKEYLKKEEEDGKS